MRAKKVLACLAAALAATAGLLFTTAAPAQAISPCMSPEPPDWCTGNTSVYDPTGALSSAVRSPGGITVSGWAHDRNGGPVDVRFTVGGTYVGLLTANKAGGPNGLSDAYSGFISVPSATGAVCAVAVNIGLGADTDLGCSSLTVDHNPYGAYDTFTSPDGKSLTIGGWAIDPDTTGSIQVLINYMGTTYGPITANLNRPDVGAAHPGYGNYHGFSGTFTPPKLYACYDWFSVTGYNVGAGSDTAIVTYVCS